MIDVDIMNTTYQDIITTFVFNAILHHIGMLFILVPWVATTATFKTHRY